jgi:LysR family glycine cleavage system transcriptional activator
MSERVACDQTPLLDMTCAKKSRIGMTRHLPPLNALRAFEAAGRHQSFTGAAKELSVSHSAISRHVRGLEDRLGAQLFRDLPRGVELTDAGAQYLAQISPALDAISEASEVFSDKPTGLVTVDSEPLFASKWLIPRLGDFYDRYPEIELRLDARRELADIARYQADMALRFFHGQTPGPEQPMLGRSALYPYAVPELAAQIKTPADILKFRRYRDRYLDTWSMWASAAGVDPAPFADGVWRLRATLAVEAALAGLLGDCC